MLLRAMRSGPAMRKARASSRLPTGVGLSRMNVSSSALLGSGAALGLRLMAESRLLLGVLGGGSLGGALATLRGLALAGLGALAAPFSGGAGRERRDGLLEADLLRLLAFGQRRIGRAMLDIGAVAALENAHRLAVGGMLAELAQRARSPRLHLAQQVDGAVEPDGEHLLDAANALIGVVVLDIGAEAADARADRLAAFGMGADLPRQREELEGEIERDLLRLHAARQGDALGLGPRRRLLLAPA